MQIAGPKINKDEFFSEKNFLGTKGSKEDLDLGSDNNSYEITKNNNIMNDRNRKKIQNTSSPVEIESSLNIQKKVDMFNVFRRARNFSKSIKKKINLRKFENLNSSQKLMIGDKIFFESHNHSTCNMV